MILLAYNKQTISHIKKVFCCFVCLVPVLPKKFVKKIILQIHSIIIMQKHFLIIKKFSDKNFFMNLLFGGIIILSKEGYW